MNGILLAAALMVVLVSSAYRLASWIKTTASRKVKDRMLLTLLAAFAIGAFCCFRLRGALFLVSIVALCVAADFLTRKKGSSDAAE